MDASRSEERPLEAPPAELRREVEAPRSAAGLWLPFMALASAAMLTIVSGIAVMTRAPRTVLEAPEESRRQELETLERAQSRRDQQRVLCRAAVHRGSLDGEAQPYDECIVPADLPATARTPEAR